MNWCPCIFIFLQNTLNNNYLNLIQLNPILLLTSYNFLYKIQNLNSLIFYFFIYSLVRDLAIQNTVIIYLYKNYPIFPKPIIIFPLLLYYFTSYTYIYKNFFINNSSYFLSFKFSIFKKVLIYFIYSLITDFKLSVCLCV